MVTLTWERRQYVWDGRQWYGADDYAIPPQGVIHRLNAMIADRLVAEDASVSRAEELLSRAKLAQVNSQEGRALMLVRRVLAMQPNHVGAAAVLCSILRQLKRAGEALATADRFRGSNYPPLLTSRAAALCDVGQWDEALRQVRQVLAIRRDSGCGEAMAVYNRIKANAPELFEDGP